MSVSFTGSGLKSRLIHSCYDKYIRLFNDQTRALQTCAYRLKSLCEQSPTRIVKTIRLPLKLISHLLDEIPWLKIINLVRDPRATLQSRRQVGMCEKIHGGTYGCASEHCRRQENDLIEADAISSRHPDRLLRVFYEDIAANPIETSRKMYDFIGSPFTPLVKDYIFNITLAGNPDNCAICTTRKNSSQHIDLWKKDISPDFLSIIEERCSYILRRYNYIF